MNSTRRRFGVGIAGVALVATGIGGAAATSSGASAAAVTHTLRFASITLAQHNVGKNTFVAADVDRRNGKVIGYDTVSGKFNTHAQTAAIDVALSINGGLLYATGVVAQNGDVTGKITGGTGKYKGARGTVTGVQVTRKKTNITVKYHL